MDALFVPAPMSGLPMRQNLLERLKNLLFYFGGIVFDTVGGAVIDEVCCGSARDFQAGKSLTSTPSTAWHWASRGAGHSDSARR